MAVSVFDDPDGLVRKLSVPVSRFPSVESGAFIGTRHNSLIRRIASSVVKSFPAILSIVSLPRLASLRRPLAVIEPSGKEILAAVVNRSGASRAICSSSGSRTMNVSGPNRGNHFSYRAPKTGNARLSGQTGDRRLAAG
jgi:hypothetical protein